MTVGVPPGGTYANWSHYFRIVTHEPTFPFSLLLTRFKSLQNVAVKFSTLLNQN
jgi:hypothetical protein